MADNAQLVAVDAGLSSTQIRISAPDRTVDLQRPGIKLGRSLVDQWVSLVIAALEECPDAALHDVALGSAGLGRETAHDLLEPLAGYGVRRVILAPRSVTSYLGALGHQPGCVIAAGTGAICLAVGPREVAQVDGWGPLIGDAGSAFWIGRTALEAAMRGHDGRRQMTALTQRVREAFPEIEVAHVELLTSASTVTRIATFAQEVDALASTDRVAGNILDKAAAHLSEAVFAGIRRAGLTGPTPPRVAAVGRVFSSQRVLRRFTDYLSLQWPSFALAVPEGGRIDGVISLLTLPTEHPLFGLVSLAERP